MDHSHLITDLHILIGVVATVSGVAAAHEFQDGWVGIVVASVVLFTGILIAYIIV